MTAILTFRGSVAVRITDGANSRPPGRGDPERLAAGRG